MILVNVDDKFIDAVKELCQEPEDLEVTESKHEIIVRLFSAMVGDIDSVGINLVKQGTGLNNTFVENTDLLTINFIKYIANISVKDAPQAALDILSLLIVSKDSYQMPLMYLEKHSNYIFRNIRLLRKLKPIIVKMFQDFDHYKETALKKIEGISE